MLSLGALSFLAPWLLSALVVLPVLWWLLRAVPPAPARRLFPGVRLLLGLKDPERRDIAGVEALVKACFDSEDYAEGRRAFMEKRRPPVSRRLGRRPAVPFTGSGRRPRAEAGR